LAATGCSAREAVEAAAAAGGRAHQLGQPLLGSSGAAAGWRAAETVRSEMSSEGGLSRRLLAAGGSGWRAAETVRSEMSSEGGLSRRLLAAGGSESRDFFEPSQRWKEVLLVAASWRKELGSGGGSRGRRQRRRLMCDVTFVQGGEFGEVGEVGKVLSMD
jgi:hypothetical protein